MRYFWYLGITGMVMIICALVVTSASAYSADFPKSYHLWQGSAAMHEIGVYGYCGTQITVKSPYGATFDLYAMKNTRPPGTCPSNEYIMSHYDRYAYSSGSGRSATMYLEEGLWCVVVYARSGNGIAYVTADSNCFPPNPVPTPVPPGPTPCIPYKTIDMSGNLYHGQATVYGFYIPTDGRSQIEWTLTGSGVCGDTPIVVASAQDQRLNRFSPFTNSNCGNSFDMYVFKDCNPQYSYCNTKYYSSGPNAYVSIANPSAGSTYYVMVFSRSGSGMYNLRMNSYRCYSETPIIVASPPVIAASTETGSGAVVSTTNEDTLESSSVSAPTAEFVPVSPQ